jgi:hypothetical protein
MPTKMPAPPKATIKQKPRKKEQRNWKRGPTTKLRLVGIKRVEAAKPTS